MFLAPDEVELNDRLKKLGIPHDIRELQHNATLCPGCVAELLELFKLPFSIYRRVAIAEALFARKPNPEQKREAIDIILLLVQQNAERYDALASLVLNELAKNVSASKVHELGKLLLDRRYGPIRPGFVRGLQKIGSGQAISYLKQAAKDPGIAASVLEALACLRVEGTLTLCEAAMESPESLHKDTIKETYRKLKRRLEKEPATIPHTTTEAVPPGLSEWSSNLDGSDMPKALKCIQKCLEAGFGKAESSEVQHSADEMSVDQEVRFKFNVKFMSRDTILWLEVFCDDEDAYDLYIFGIPELIDRIERAIEKVFK